MGRARELADLSVLELVTRVISLEHENAQLRRALGAAFCGEVFGSCSCQLTRGHVGMHVWADPSTDTMVRW